MVGVSGGAWMGLAQFKKSTVGVPGGERGRVRIRVRVRVEVGIEV